MKYAVTGTHVRREAVGFVPIDVEYEIEGTIYSRSSRRYDEPDEPPEVDFTKAVRIDPITAEREIIPYNRWPFSDAEESSIVAILIAAGDE
jgi:hypothetical protein